MTVRHFLKRQNRSQNKIREITVKFRNDVKSVFFLHLLCRISAIFEDIDLKFLHILSSHCFCKKIVLRVKILKKKKMLNDFGNFSKFPNFENSE